MNQLIKTVFFTNKSSHGVELLEAIRASGIQVSAIVIERAAPISTIQKTKYIMSMSFHGFCSALLRKARRQVRRGDTPRRDEEYYRSFAQNVITVDDINSTECERFVKEIEPDLIVLGGASIIREGILSIPQIGILNAHPGLLPKYRGVDVIPWAIVHGDDVGVTVHFIDKGVDTGMICVQKSLRLEPGDTIERLRRKAEILAGKLMAETIQTIVSNGVCETFENPRSAGKQFYRMDRKTLRIAERRLKERIANVKSAH